MDNEPVTVFLEITPDSYGKNTLRQFQQMNYPDIHTKHRDYVFKDVYNNILDQKHQAYNEPSHPVTGVNHDTSMTVTRSYTHNVGPELLNIVAPDYTTHVVGKRTGLTEYMVHDRHIGGLYTIITTHIHPSDISHRLGTIEQLLAAPGTAPTHIQSGLRQELQFLQNLTDQNIDRYVDTMGMVTYSGVYCTDITYLVNTLQPIRIPSMGCTVSVYNHEHNVINPYYNAGHISEVVGEFTYPVVHINDPDFMVGPKWFVCGNTALQVAYTRDTDQPKCVQVYDPTNNKIIDHIDLTDLVQMNNLTEVWTIGGFSLFNTREDALQHTHANWTRLTDTIGEQQVKYLQLERKHTDITQQRIVETDTYKRRVDENESIMSRVKWHIEKLQAKLKKKTAKLKRAHSKNKASKTTRKKQKVVIKRNQTADNKWGMQKVAIGVGIAGSIATIAATVVKTLSSLKILGLAMLI